MCKLRFIRVPGTVALMVLILKGYLVRHLQLRLSVKPEVTQRCTGVVSLPPIGLGKARTVGRRSSCSSLLLAVQSEVLHLTWLP